MFLQIHFTMPDNQFFLILFRVFAVSKHVNCLILFFFKTVFQLTFTNGKSWKVFKFGPVSSKLLS